MPAKNFYIALYDAAADVLSFSYYVDEQDEAPPPRRPRRGFTEYILRTGKPLLAPPEVLQELVKAGEIESRGTQPHDRVGVPLRLNGEPMGVLVVQSYGGDIRYGEEDKNALQFISEQVAMAVSRKRAEEERHFLQIVTQAIGASEDLTSGLRATVQALCEASGWVLGQVWTPCADGAHLEVTPAWYGNAPGTQEFRTATEGLALLPGEGVPGRAWSTKQRVWLQEGLFDDDSARRSAASALGIKLGVAIPVLSEGKVLAVMEFFATKAQAQDQGLLEVIASVGGQLGTPFLRKRAEQALRASEERFRALAETANDAIISANQEGNIIHWNKGAERAFGYTAAEILGKSLTLIMPERFRDAHRQEMRRYLSTEEAHVVGKTVELAGLRKDGSEFPLDLSLASWKTGEGTFFTGIIRDITDRKRAEAELRKAKEAAEAANRAKSEFLANMSHEIRTPMNGIIGMAELALDTDLNEEQREYIGMAKASADSLLAVINAILDFSKIEAGRMELENIEFDLVSNFSDTVKTLALRAHQKQLELISIVDPDIPGFASGDPTRLRQVLVNLVGNAIKFTERGEITVRVGKESEDAGGITLRFSVADSGVGIPREKRDLIFEAFSQADSSTTRHFGGTGLGLTISSQLVRMMGGRLWVESELGRGSTFHFTARFGPAAAPSTKGTSASYDRLSGLRVLVVDDNATNRRVLEGTLKGWGAEPVQADGGLAALATLQEAKEAGRPYSVVLTDCHMPGMDGFALAEKIRQDPGLAGATIMMLTSGGQRGDGERCRKLGISGYLTKPIAQAELLEALLATLGPSGEKSGGQGLVTRHSIRESRRPLRVLLAEDNVVNRELVVRLLTKRGHSVTPVTNGREAVAVLEGASEGQFDLVLMDVQMPEMDGLQATAAIREREGITQTHLSIIALTAFAMKGDRERCLAAGMDSYVTKPINPNELFAAIESLIPAQGERTSGALMEPKAEKALDVTALLARVDGDAQLLSELAQIFVSECPHMMEEIRRALEDRDAKALERASHALKGSVGNFTATGPFEAALHLERIARSEDLESAPLVLRRLEDEIAQLTPVLTSLGTGVIPCRS